MMRLRNLEVSRVCASHAALAGLTAAVTFATIKPAQAVPAFAGQTGYPCQQCHIGALGPQLTPFGREFKIKGYTLRGGEGLPSKIPFALWVQSGFENYSKNLPIAAETPHYNTNNNAGVDAISLFLAGGLNEHVGAFIQVTYDNTQKALAEDNTDIRVVDDVTLAGKDAEIGLSFNNAPGLSDPYNSNYVWGYPFISPFLAIGPTYAPILGDSAALQGNSYGVDAYTWYDDHIYADLGVYETQGPGMMKLLGEAYGPGSATGVEPYASFTYAWFWGNNNVHLGGTYFGGRYNPTNTFVSNGTLGNYGHNTYNDFVVDNGYQYMGDDDVNIITIDGYYTYEDQNLKGFSNPASPLFATTKKSNNLQEFRETATYYYRQTYGATISFASIWGNKNKGLYDTGADDGSGSINGSPANTNITLEADWVPFGKENAYWPLRPFINWKLGLQYIMYTQFNGAATNYDGFGRNASDNNTLFLFLWTVF
jgi:hypothetical protein